MCRAPARENRDGAVEREAAWSGALGGPTRCVARYEHVSLVSTDAHSSLEWCHPGPARMRWDDDLIIRRIMRWVTAARRGNADRKTINVPAEFVPGDSIGPVPLGCK